VKKTCLALYILPFLLSACSDGAPEDPGGECGDPTLPGSIQFEVANLGVDEDAGSADLVVTRKVGCAGEVEVSYAVLGGTAIEGEDYRLEAGRLSWADGGAKNQIIHVDILDDDIIEGDKSLEIQLFIESGDDELGEPHSLFLTILEDDISGPPPFLVADINNSGTDASHPGWYEGPALLNGVAYFAADDGLHGVELWKSDGTAEGTRMVVDLFVGPTGSGPESLLVAFDKLYFQAEDSEGSPWWRSDGSEAGTVPIDPESEPASLFGANLSIGGRRYWIKNTQLWTSDDSGGSAEMLREFAAEPSELTALGTTLVFAADDGTTGAELWQSDGSAGGTQLLIDLAPDEASSNPQRLVVINDLLLFNADDGNGLRAYRCDGTAGGTELINAPSHGDIRISERTATVGATLYFTYGVFSSYTELWKTDGQDENTAVVKEIGPTTQGSFPHELTPWGDLLFFSATDHEHGYELWKTDGTEAGTQMVADINPNGNAGPSGLLVVGESLLFSAQDEVNVSALWKTDGTEAGTQKIVEIRLFTKKTLLINNAMLMTADDGVHGVELWQSDGSSEGTKMLSDINAVPRGSQPTPAAVMGSTLFFGATEGHDYQALWASDGTEQGTRLIHTPYYGDRVAPVVVGTQVFFTSWIDETGMELFVSDGSTAGTHLVLDINPDPARGAAPSFLTAMGGLLYFSADDDVINDARLGRELWVSDGSEAGTHIVADLNPGSASSYPTEITLLENTLFMSARGPNGGELYKSDGSEAGSVEVIDLMPGISSSDPSLLTPMGTKLAFLAEDESGTGIWICDGSPGGTVRVYQGETDKMASAGDKLYFIVGGSLYVSAGQPDDGSELFTLPDWGDVASMMPLADQLLFITRGSDVAIWRTDGSTEGTIQLKQIRPNYGNDLADQFKVMDNILYFAANDGALGTELWRSDGSPEGTYRLADISPGPTSSSPGDFVVMENTLYFSAHSLEFGRELWGYKP